MDIDKIDDPMKKMAVISFIHNFGQVPKQVSGLVGVGVAMDRGRGCGT